MLTRALLLLCLAPGISSKDGASGGSHFGRDPAQETSANGLCGGQGSPDSTPPGTGRTPSLSASGSGLEKLAPLAWCRPGATPARGAPGAVNPVVCRPPGSDTRAPRGLRVRVQTAAGDALCLAVDFGDGLVVQKRTGNVSDGAGLTACHQYWRGTVPSAVIWTMEGKYQKGFYMLKADIYNELYGTKVELGPYYVEVGHGSISVFMNSSSIHEDEVLIFADAHINQKSTVVMHRFPLISYNMSFASQNQVDGSQAWTSMTVWYKMQPVSVYTNGTVFATDTDIDFAAVTRETSPLEFVWYFGDDPPVRTTSRSIQRRLGTPQRYLVKVKASNGVSSVVSKPHPISVQRKIVASRLTSASSALINSSVTFECRITFGTEVAYLWDFGDGTSRLGNSTDSHVFNREGAFTVEVLAFNHVSAARLRTRLFVVPEPCQPPPVKNLGPGKVQIWRSQPVKLGVTFEAAILCDISQGISYSWSLVKADGAPVALPPGVDSHRQTIIFPSFFLEYGNYTAVAKVQIQGHRVSSVYAVGVEVRPRAPVSVISEGTHLFVSKTPSSTIVLRGTQSYDPDHPRTTLRYHWACAPASEPGRPCFKPSPSSHLDARAPAISFATEDLSSSYDQFLVTLTVSSGGRSSPEAQAFLSIRSDSVFRFVHISWVNFKTLFLNWNEELSLQAACEDCAGIPHLSYAWDLSVVNATEKSSVEVPFCRSVELLDFSRFGAALALSQLDVLPTEPHTPGPELTATLAPGVLLSPAAHSARRRNSTGSTATAPIAASNTSVQEEAWEEAPVYRESGGSEAGGVTSPPERARPPGSSSPHSSSTDLSDFEAYYSDIQEAIPSQGRQPGNKINLPGSESSESDGRNPSDGDNLIEPFRSTDRHLPLLMVDWSKSLISRAAFQGYTLAGITEQTVTIKPFSLRSGETYVIQASVASKHSLLGKAQLYLTVNKVPQDVTCQVQPHRGYEAHTLFSVFCMAGKPDFHYEFSYQIGNASKRILYRGRDVQYYFALPAGEPLDNYKVTVSTEITDGEGSSLQPCAAAVTVLPRYHGSDCPGEDLYNSSLKNLSNLLLVGSYTEIRNYITMITKILSRLAKESRSSSCGQWSQIQDALISSVCRLAFTNQEEMVDSVLMLSDLVSVPNKLTFRSAVLLLKYARALLSHSQLPGRLVIDRGLVSELTFLVSGVFNVSDEEKPRNTDYLQEEGIKVISDLSLSYLSSSKELQLHVGTGLVEFQTRLHRDLELSVQSIGPVTVHLPGDLAGMGPAGTETCYISQLMLFKKNLYRWGQAPGQVDGTVGLSLYNCSSRRLINRSRLKTPVTVEFGEEDGPDNQRNKTTFKLLRNKVNFHQFIGTSENSQESLQIRIEFSKPITRAFPVMLLVRFYKKPTPSTFFVKQIYFWNEQIVQIYIPAVSLKVANSGYLALLDANYDRKPPNKYLAKAVNYTVHFQWLRCLLWDKREWTSERFSPQPGTSPENINCSYDRLAAFTILKRKLNASFEMSDISELQTGTENLLPSIFIVFLMVLFALLVTQSKRVDRREKRKLGYVFLQERRPPGQRLYAVVVDTGLRAPAQLTAKVYIILCGENGLSETKELSCPEKPLFERNSRHTFILSVAERLGPLWKVRLWHDSRGPSPSWYVSHVMVRELLTGQSWFFPAECWLAASRGDGRVRRELIRLRHGLGFQKLWYLKFTEYLEDVHVWISVYSRPSHSHYLHTPRLMVSFSLLCVYSCLTAVLTAVQQEQLLWGVGPIRVPLASFWGGLLCTLLASPGALLLSLLFRLSQEAIGPCPAGEQREAAPAPASQGRTPDAQREYKRSASDVLSGSGSCLGTAAGGSGAGHRPAEGEACGTEPAPRRGLPAPAPPRQRLPPPWAGSAVWAVCGLVSVACGLGTGVLGYRFGPEQCGRWLHLLLLSVACCALLTQPLMIGFMALGFAWKRRDDPDFFAESLREATRNLESELEQLSSNCCAPDCASEFEKVLAARGRARRLRWARPPGAAQLRASRARTRRERRAQQELRDIFQSILTLLLLLLIIRGKGSQDERSLNQAIRREFTRMFENIFLQVFYERVAFEWFNLINARNSFSGLSSTDEWWDWSLTTLLDSLFWGNSTHAAVRAPQPGALGGKCYLIGVLVVKQLKASSNRVCKPSSPSSALSEDSLPTFGPSVRGPECPCTICAESHNVTPGERRGCRETDDCVLSLGRTRPAATATLGRLRAGGWIDGATRAVVLHLTLYNPPSQLWSHARLSAQLLPAGRLLPSAEVESVAVPGGGLCALPQLVFLVLNLTQLWFQLHIMTEKGIFNYWRKPSHWLELSLVGMGIAYYTASSYLVVLAGEAIDQIHKGFFQEFMDLSLIASWNQVQIGLFAFVQLSDPLNYVLLSQRTRSLEGILLFLLMLKCICLLGLQRTMASCSLTMHRSISSIIAPGLAGLLALAALSQLCSLLPFAQPLPSSTFVDSIPRLLPPLLGRSQREAFLGLYESNQRAMACYYGAFCLATAFLWFGMLKGSLLTFARKGKSFRSKDLVSLKDLIAYAWGKALTFLGLERPMLEEAKMAENHNYYLEEFSNLLDELLLKINVLSDSLQLSLLEQLLYSTMEARREDSSSVGISDYQATGVRVPEHGGLRDPLSGGS